MKLKLGENLRRLRKEQELTQEQFSTTIGVSFQAVSCWENGTAYPDMELLPSLSAFWGVGGYAARLHRGRERRTSQSIGRGTA